MKARLLYPMSWAPRHPLRGEMAPAGTIIDDPHAYYLCHSHQSFHRPLPRNRKTNEEQLEHVIFDGNRGQALKYEAEPADAACLAECIKLGWLPADYELREEEPTELVAGLAFELESPEAVPEAPEDATASLDLPQTTLEEIPLSTPPAKRTRIKS